MVLKHLFPNLVLFLLKVPTPPCVCVTVPWVCVHLIAHTHKLNQRFSCFFSPCTETQMHRDGLLWLTGDSCHELSVESHLVLSLEFSAAKLYIIIALCAPFPPCFLSYSETSWHLRRTLCILHPVLSPCPSAITLSLIIVPQSCLFPLGGSSSSCGSNKCVPYGAFINFMDLRYILYIKCIVKVHLLNISDNLIWIVKLITKYLNSYMFI